ncbi:prephenate dehydratase [Abditibacterium utsteinense]|nr:prephenate dehydratase [Abditibacterium utsteinense]
MNDDLGEWRDKIDALDTELLTLLQKRAICALEVGEIKKKKGWPFHDPSREKLIYQKLRQKQLDLGGVLPPEAINAIFREVISACRAAEHPVKVAFLGPAGTNTQEAAMQFFGSAIEAIPCATPDEACHEVAAGNAGYAVIAIENSINGLVVANLDILAHTNLIICAEIELNIHHCLLSNSDLGRVKVVYSHEQGIAQCKNWILSHVPGASLVPVTSTARGAEMASREEDAAAIGSALAANIYGLQIAARNIEDLSGNKTRFFVVSTADKAPKASGRDKTSLTFLTSHKPGALVDVLGVFASHGVNISMIQSRPSRQQAWEYRFFADVSGHSEDETLKAALESLKDLTVSYKIIGSYPEA